MIIRRLKEAENFSDIEKSIAEYLLSSKQNISKMSIRDLAEATYTSTSTITRFCHKLGLSGYSEFKIQFNTEYRNLVKNSKEYDENRPFQKHDSIQDIAFSIANINIRGIEESLEMLDYKKLEKVVEHMHNCDVIYIYGQGSSLLSAYEFKTKMLRIGKLVQIEQDYANQRYQAANSKQTDFSILISYSGENKEVLEIANILKQRRQFFVAITSDKENTLQTLAPRTIKLGTSEKKSLLGKLETFSSHSATHFILDCLYASLYTKDYEENFNYSKRAEMLIQKKR